MSDEHDHFDHIVLNHCLTEQLKCFWMMMFHNIYLILQVLQKILILDDLFLDELKESSLRKISLYYC